MRPRLTTTRTSRPPVRRTRAACFAAALAGLLALGWTLAAGPAPARTGLAVQANPTNTPIRLTAFTPAAPKPSPTSDRQPTTEAIVVVVDEGEDDGATQVPDQSEPLNIEFAADDWDGGYFQGNRQWYGRAWTAVYGAQSPYPSATLTFELDEVPAEPLVLLVAGLDDEWAGANPIALEINGERVYEGDGPFASWDGNTANRGADADWTTVRITMPANLFEQGENTIAFFNRSPSADWGVPPYFLLSTARLTVESEADAADAD